ncbi:MAG: Prophage integrase IntA [Desulfovibrio sp.]
MAKKTEQPDPAQETKAKEKPQKITPTYLSGLKAIAGETQNVSCGDGLSLRVSPKGKKSWYLRYMTLSADGKPKQNIVCLGEFHSKEFNLKEAREEASKQKRLAKGENANLAQVKKEKLLEKARDQNIPTFQELAEDWLELRTAEWEARSAKQNRGRLAANVYPVIGDMPVPEITVADVERALKLIIERGSLEVARRVHTLIVSIFKYGIARQVIENPDIVVRLTWFKENMPRRKKTSLYAEELTPDEIGQLLRTIHGNKGRWTPPVAYALLLAPYCALRPSELLGAQWSEIDLEAGEWIVPAERMKMGRAHLVPLPRQAIELLRKAHEFSSKRTFVFPSTSSIGKGKPVSTMALIQAFRRMGYSAASDNRFVTHAFRGMFSTTAYNILGASSLVVELQLAHSEKDKIKAAYHKTSLRTAIDERRELLQRYADYLDGLRASVANAK